MEGDLKSSHSTDAATAARVIIRHSLEEELVRSSSEKGPLRLAFPHKVLDAWFPQLFIDLPVQE